MKFGGNPQGQVKSSTDCYMQLYWFVSLDCVQFYLTNDPRNNKLLAIQLLKLSPGSVVIETVSEEVCIGRVEVEPRPLKNGEIHDSPTLGRVSYDKHGVCEIV